MALPFYWSCSPSAPERKNNLTCSFLDVGQGDATLFQTSDGKALLVDAGSEGCGSDTLLQQKGVKRIDVIVLSHAHEDHFGNLRNLADKFTINRICFNHADFSKTEYPDFYDLFHYLVDTLKIDTTILSRGRSITDFPELSCRCVWPPPVPPPLDDPINALSIVLEISIGNTTFYMSGDISMQTEAYLIPTTSTNNAILKVAHHGSKSATSSAFLDLYHPMAAIVSVGKNNYGHPCEETLNRLINFGVTTYRTNKSGTITIQIQDKGYALFPENN